MLHKESHFLILFMYKATSDFSTAKLVWLCNGNNNHNNNNDIMHSGAFLCHHTLISASH